MRSAAADQEEKSDDAGDLAVEGGTALVSDAGVAQVCVLAVAVIKHEYPAGVGIVAAGTGSEEIFLPIPLKERRRFPGQRREQPIKMDGALSFHRSIIIAEGGADELEVGTLKPDVALPDL